MCRRRRTSTNAITAIERALADYEQSYDHPLAETCPREPGRGLEPAATIVTYNGGPFRSFRFEAFVTAHPELRHVGTRVRSPGQNGSRERGFGSLKYERLFLEEIDDVLAVVKHADAYRVEHNTVRPHEAIAWNRPIQIHPGLVGPRIPNFPRDRKPANYLTRDTTTQQRPRPGVFDQRLLSSPEFC